MESKNLKQGNGYSYSRIIRPSDGPDRSVIDLPPGLGKTYTVVLGSLMYVLLNFKDLKNKYQTRCIPQVSRNQTMMIHSAIYRNIIGICCPLHLVNNWKQTVSNVISRLSTYVERNYDKTLKLLVVKGRVNKLQDDLGKENEIVFVIFKCMDHGICYDFSLDADNFREESEYQSKIENNQIKICYPVLIEDESHMVRSQFNKPMYSNLPLAAHYIAVTATFSLNFKSDSLNGYLLDGSVNDFDRVSNAFFVCRTNYQETGNQLCDLYSKILIHNISWKIVNNSYGEEFDQFQTKEKNFLSLKESAAKNGVIIPEEFIMGFTDTKLKNLVKDQVHTIEKRKSSVSYSESIELERKKKKMENFLSRMVDGNQECPICFCEFDFHTEPDACGNKRKCEKEEVIFVSCCQYRFHRSCLDSWDKNQCPLCREKTCPLDISNEVIKDTEDITEKVEIEKLENSSISCFSKFLSENPFEKEDERKGFLPYSLLSRCNQLILSFLHYRDCFPWKNLHFLLISKNADIQNFIQSINKLIPEDKRYIFNIQEHKNRGDNHEKMTTQKNMKNLEKFQEYKQGGIISILVCDDQKYSDCMIGLDLKEIDGIICLGKYKNEEKEIQRLGRITRISSAMKEKSCICLTI